jgi:hypothetical protein
MGYEIVPDLVSTSTVGIFNPTGPSVLDLNPSNSGVNIGVIRGVGIPNLPNDVANKNYVDTKTYNKIQDILDTTNVVCTGTVVRVRGDLDFEINNTYKITSLKAGVADNDGVNVA